MNEKLFRVVSKLKQHPDVFEELFPPFPTTQASPNTIINYAYDGRYYQGNTFLFDSPFTVEYWLFSALHQFNYIDGIPLKFDRAGRTDAGVSALDNYIAVYSESKSFSLVKLNNYLPDNIIIRRVFRASVINLRGSCVSRNYVYKLSNLNEQEIAIVKRNSQLLKGTFDFKFLSLEKKSAVRTIFKCDVLRQNQNALLIISGQAFCRNQIRCIAATIKDDCFNELLTCKRYYSYKIGAPYQLCLQSCKYDQSSWELMSQVPDEDFSEFISKNGLEPFQKQVKDDEL